MALRLGMEVIEEIATFNQIESNRRVEQATAGQREKANPK